MPDCRAFISAFSPDNSLNNERQRSFDRSIDLPGGWQRRLADNQIPFEVDKIKAARSPTGQ